MVEPLGAARVSRAERKQLTRRALLDGTFDLLEDRNFSGLSLREVARAAGIVPTAFYRHFASLDDLGVALAEESMRVARQVLRDARRGGDPITIDTALDALGSKVGDHPREFRFVTRERHGGMAEIRRAIGSELRALVGELAIDLARTPALDAWAPADLETAADLLTVTALESVPGLLGPQRDHAAALDRAGRQLRIITTGMTAARPRG
ncbi:TetR family transcriptional regulator [Tomitella fengzijianii]|uniref:TetR family transcriptional regulator n=1 Tax=Tomitella fengzijianii TaxID=2597660 RepID=A0A516X6D1_9ACTN|nr:TetR family transcriptional regulator [Tomitella fengzijianii]QDQ98632.1 TetR family transcriptional regulator [Tomitella fengzijianii]